MPYPYPIPEGVTITWEQEVRDDRQDACWYMGDNAIATITYKDRIINVDRNGELRVLSSHDELVKDSQDWESIGVHNDNDLWDIDDTLHWEMNPWFDCYEIIGDEAYHLDMVEYSVYDAVNRAVDMIVMEEVDA